MLEPRAKPCTAFDGDRVIARGALIDVALAVRAVLVADPTARLFTFDDSTGAVIDLDLRGSTAEIVARLEDQARRMAASADPQHRDEAGNDGVARGRGRPKLGVVAREVTLLPRHWAWLAAQPGGASQALRRLVDEARRSDGGRSRSRAAREAAYRFMSALAGNLPGFEEASRSLFADDRARFAEHTAAWPADVRTYARNLAWGEPTAETGRAPEA